MKAFKILSGSKLLHLSLILLIITSLSLSISCGKKDTGTIKIGAILPLTGDAAVYGEMAKKGIEQKVIEINSSGGIGNKKLRIIYEDDQALPDKGVAAFQKLVSVDKVQVVLGAMPSSVTLAIAPIAERKEVVLFSPASSSPKVSQAGDYVFRNVTSDIYDGMIMARYAFNELNLRKFGIIFVNNDFGVGLRSSFRSEVEKLGGAIVTVESFNQNDTDFKTQIQKLKESKVEAVFMIAYKEAGRLLRQMNELKCESTILSVGVFEDPQVFDLADNAANGVYYTFRSFDPEAEDERTRSFVSSFTKAYGMAPDLFAVYSYDAVGILAYAIEHSDNTPKGIKEALYKIKGFPGVTGNISFDENGDVMLPMGIKKSISNKFEWVERNYFVY